MENKNIEKGGGLGRLYRNGARCMWSYFGMVIGHDNFIELRQWNNAF